MQSWFWDEFPLPGQAVFDWEHQQLAVVSRAAGNLDVFVIGYDKKIWSTYWNDQQGWAPEPFPLPGQAVFDWEHQQLAVVSRAAGNLDVFVIGYDKKIWSTYWNDQQGWAPEPFPLPGQAVFDWQLQQLAVVSRAAGNLDVFVIGYDKKIWSTYWNDQQGWAPEPFPLPGQAVFDWEHQQLAVVSRAAGNLDVFVIGYDKKIWSTYWNDQQGWAPEPFPLPGQAVFDWEHQQLAVVSRAAGNLDVFVIGYDKKIWSTYWNDQQGWAPEPFPLPGQAVFDWEHQQLAVVSRAAGNLDVFVIGYDKKIWSTYWNDQQGWAPEPFPLPGQAVFDWQLQQLAVVSRAAGNLDVFVIGYDKKIWSTFWGEVGVSATRLIDNGPPGSRYTIAVVGDGFTAWDQTAYNQAVDALVTNGLFSHDYFADNRPAFNLVRVNALSVDSGVSTKTYDAAGTVTATVNRNTMFGAIFNGDWAHCWVEDGPNTAATLQHVLDLFVPDRRITMLLLNNPGFGGCGGGGRLTLPLGVSWSTVAHEFGHALGGLADEYHGRNDVYTGGEPTPVNATINTNRATLKWGWAVAATTPIPTGGDDYTPPKPAGWDDSQGVGLFEGGMSNYATGLYRPVVNCRMRTNDPRYCTVCAARMHTVTDPFLPALPPAALPAAGPGIDRENAVQSDGPYLRVRVLSESGRLSVLSAHQVDGPFVEPDPPEGAIVQEVLVGGRTVAVGDVGDRALSRSFSEPGADGPREHHVQALDRFEFVVRLPVEAVRGVDPRQVTIRLGQLAGREGPRRRLRSDTTVTPGFAVAPEHAAVTESSVNLGETELPDALAAVLGGG